MPTPPHRPENADRWPPVAGLPPSSSAADGGTVPYSRPPMSGGASPISAQPGVARAPLGRGTAPIGAGRGAGDRRPPYPATVAPCDIPPPATFPPTPAAELSGPSWPEPDDSRRDSGQRATPPDSPSAIDGGLQARGEPSRRRLADELYLSINDFQADRSRLDARRAAGLLLAGGLLAELVLVGKARVEYGQVHITDERPSLDPLVHRLIAVSLSEPDAGGSASAWLEYVGVAADTPVGDLIASRLVNDRVLIPAPRRSRTSGLGFTPVQRTDADGPADRIHTQLRRGGELADHDCLLAALLDAAGLMSVILPAGSQSSADALRTQIAGLPARLAEVVQEVRVAVANALLTGTQ